MISISKFSPNLSCGQPITHRHKPKGNVNFKDSTILKSTDDSVLHSFQNNSYVYNPSEELLHPAKTCEVHQLSATSLAYIGDAVFELFTRSRYVWPQRRTSDLQNKVVGVVRAETQSQLLSKMLEQSSGLSFTPKEYSVLNRGRNAGGAGSRKKNKGPKRFFKEDGSQSGGATIYQDSTAFEALIGYLYIKDPDKCFQMLEWIKLQLDEIDNITA